MSALITAAYPLNAMTLGNNLMVSFIGHNCPPLAKHETYWSMWCPRRFRANKNDDNDPVVFSLNTDAGDDVNAPSTPLS